MIKEAIKNNSKKTNILTLILFITITVTVVYVGYNLIKLYINTYF